MTQNVFPDGFAWWHLPVVFLAGLIGESYGALIGGGSIVIQGVLVFLGFPLRAVIATDIAGAIGTEAGILREAWRDVLARKRLVLLILVPSVIGGVLGTILLLRIPQETITLLVVAAVLFLLIHIYVGRHQPMTRIAPIPFVFAAFLLLGAYSNLVSIGEGTFGKLAVASLLGLTFVQSHGLKTMATLPLRIWSLTATAFSGLILWPYLLTLLVANYLAGLYATRWARKVPERHMRAALIVVAVVFVLYLLTTL